VIVKHELSPVWTMFICANPYHSSSNCLSWGQVYNFPHEQMNTNFSSPRFESNLNFYNPD